MKQKQTDHLCDAVRRGGQGGSYLKVDRKRGICIGLLSRSASFKILLWEPRGASKVPFMEEVHNSRMAADGGRQLTLARAMGEFLLVGYVQRRSTVRRDLPSL